MTFKIKYKINLEGILEKSNIVHVKNGCIFSINALNKLIEKDFPNSQNYKECEINWNNYKNKLVLIYKYLSHLLMLLR